MLAQPVLEPLREVRDKLCFSAIFVPAHFLRLRCACCENTTNKEGYMEPVYRFIVRRSWPILTVIFLITLFFTYHARRISIDSSVASILPQDDPDKRYYDEVRLLFGSDDIAIVGLIADNIYTPQVLHKIQHLTDELRKVPEVKSVVSLTNAPDIVAIVAGTGSELLVPEIPSTPAAWEELQK